jgi:hypothetical protein
MTMCLNVRTAIGEQARMDNPAAGLAYATPARSNATAAPRSDTPAPTMVASKPSGAPIG